MSKYMDFKGGDAIEPEGEALVRKQLWAVGRGLPDFSGPSWWLVLESHSTHFTRA